jgi:hypothetical protein
MPAMPDRTLCAVTKINGKDCGGPVPEDAPVDLCLLHLQEAYLYIRDIIEKFEPGEVNYNPALHPQPSVVYYVRFGDRIKIGTSSDVWTRITSIPCDRLLATEPGDYALERERHEQFKAFRLNRNSEWFRDCPEIRAHINALRREYGDPVEKRYPPSARVPILEDAPWEDPASWKPRSKTR